MKTKTTPSKRIAALLLTLTFILALMPTTGLRVSAFSRGDGSLTDPYIITTAEQLNDVRNNLTAHYKLGSDIDLSVYTNWEPIGKYSSDGATHFKGTLDGDAHVIRNLTINRSAENDVSLFGFIDGGTVQNLGIVGGSVTGSTNVGGVAGYNSGGTIENCYNTIAVNGSNYVGGVVGRNATSTIENCYNTGAVNGTGSSYIGGVAGYNSGGTIENCYNMGAVNGTNVVGVGVSGVVGYNSGTIKNCYNTGTVTGICDSIGGVAGYNSGGTIENCYNTGAVTGTGNNYAGGVAGENNGGTIKNCYNTGAVTGSSNIGGVAGGNLNGTIKNCYYNKDKYNGNAIGYRGASITNVEGLTTTDMTNYTAFDGGNMVNLNTDNVWITTDDATTCCGTATFYPQLKVFAESSNAYTREQSLLSVLATTATQIPLGEQPFLHGGGTQGIPYEIYTAGQLNHVRKHLGAHFKLMNDIDLSAYTNWESIGNSSRFTGTFNGNGHVIRNLTIDRSTEDNVGLFGYIGTGGKVQNLGIFGGNVTGRSNVGGVAGYNYGGTIENCYITGKVEGRGNSVGGVAGGNTIGGAITNCYNTGGVNGSNYVGGVVGSNHEGGAITNCYNTGEVNGNSNVGGVAGRNATSTITNCYYNKETSEQTNGIGDPASDTNATGLTTAQMIHMNVLESGGDMSGLNSTSAWTKRAKTADYCYYPELSVFYGNGALDTTQKIASELSVRVARLDVTATAIASDIVLGQTLSASSITGSATYGLNHIAGTFAWNDRTIMPPVGKNLHTATFTPYSDLYKEKEVTVSVNVTVRAVQPDEHIIRLTANPQNGGNPHASHSSAAVGTVITLSANPNTNYTFTGWTVTSPAGLMLSDAANPNATFIMPNGDAEITANYVYTPPVTPTPPTAQPVYPNYPAPTPPTPTPEYTPSTTPPPEPKPFINVNGAYRIYRENIDTSKDSRRIELKEGDISKGKVYVTIPAIILKELARSNSSFFIEIVTPYGTYRVPVNFASLIEGLDELLGQTGLNIDDIAFKINLTDMSSNSNVNRTVRRSLPNGEAIAIVDFTVEILNLNTGNVIGVADTFKETIMRLIPLPNGAKLMRGRWGGYKYDEVTGELVFAPHKTKMIGKREYVVIESTTNSVYVIATNAVEFADVAKTAWYGAYVEQAAAKLLVRGMDSGLYEPERSVTRAEFVQMMANALSLAKAKGTIGEYGDVAKDAWYYDAVMRAKSAGLLGRFSGSFAPNTAITREEMAAILAAAVRCEGYKVAGEKADLSAIFRDYGDIGTAHKTDVELVYRAGLMQGVGEGDFAPKGVVTRAQAAAVQIRLLEMLGKIE